MDVNGASAAKAGHMSTEDLLRSAEDVLEEVVEKGMGILDDPEVRKRLRLSDDKDWSVAHELAHGRSEKVQEGLMKDKDILGLSDIYGRSVAHELARWGTEKVQMGLLGDSKLLRLKDDEGWSVAHMLAMFGTENVKLRLLKMKGILKLETEDGRSLKELLEHHSKHGIADHFKAR